MFFNATLASVQAMYFEMAPEEVEMARRAGLLEELRCIDVLPGGHRERLTQYQRRRDESTMAALGGVFGEAGASPSSVGDIQTQEAIRAMQLTEPMLAMVTQTVNQKGGHLSQEFPTLLRNAMVWSFQANRINTGGEGVQVQGVPYYVYGDDGLRQFPYESALHGYFPFLSNYQLRLLTGNSIHAAVAAALQLFVMGSFVWYSEAVNFSRIDDKHEQTPVQTEDGPVQTEDGEDME